MRYNRMNFDAFVQALNEDSWKGKTPEEKLASLQQFEDINAAMQNRPACKVSLIPPDTCGPGTMGAYSHVDNVILVNPKYVFGKAGFLGGLGQYNLANALQTIAHEGRHAWQHYAVEHKELRLVDEATRLAMQMNFVGYGQVSATDDFYLYSAQKIELDARLYAQEILRKIIAVKKASGDIPTSFENALVKAENSEQLRTIKILNNKKIKAEMDRIEKETLQSLKKIDPKTDYTGLSFFDDFKKIIKANDISKFKDIKPITIQTDAVDKQIDKMDQVKLHSKNKFL